VKAARLLAANLRVGVEQIVRSTRRDTHTPSPMGSR